MAFARMAVACESRSGRPMPPSPPCPPPSLPLRTGILSSSFASTSPSPLESFSAFFQSFPHRSIVPRASSFLTSIPSCPCPSSSLSSSPVSPSPSSFKSCRLRCSRWIGLRIPVFSGSATAPAVPSGVSVPTPGSLVSSSFPVLLSLRCQHGCVA